MRGMIVLVFSAIAYVHAVGSGTNSDSSVKAGPAFKSHSNPVAAQDLVIPRKKQKLAHLNSASKLSPKKYSGSSGSGEWSNDSKSSSIRSSSSSPFFDHVGEKFPEQVKINDRTYHMDPDKKAFGEQGGVAFGTSSDGEKIIIKQFIDRKDFTEHGVGATRAGFIKYLII